MHYPGFLTRDGEGKLTVHNNPNPRIITASGDDDDDGDGDDQLAPAQELEAWLRSAFETELPGTIDKAILYGSVDLEVMADAMGKMLPQIDHDEQLKLQAAVAFYLLGKVARAMGALKDGRSPTNDTWYDAHIYSMMGLRIQEVGHWLRTQ